MSSSGTIHDNCILGIVSITVIVIILLSYQGLGPYSVSKTALMGLTKVLAQELASDNIRVNCIAPGVIQTNFSKAVGLSC